MLSPSCVLWELGSEKVALCSAPLTAETALLCSLGLAGCGLGVKCTFPSCVGLAPHP